MKVELVDYMGDDNSVVDAARVSMDKASDGYSDEQNTKLIHYLAKHNHWSPFAHTAITLRMSAPVSIRTQAFKHKVGFSENEESRRYISSRPEVFVPEYWRTAPKGSVKQGSGTGKVNISSTFTDGFCVECGIEIKSMYRGRVKKYCSDKCKYTHGNKSRNPYKTVFQNCAGRVKREGKWEFNLDFNAFEFPEYCPYLGIKLDYSYGKGSIKENSPSFDRIDSDKGYEKGNVRIISSKANTMKSSANKDDLIKFAKSVLLIHGGVSVDTTNSYESITRMMVDTYMAMIEDNVAPEQARLILPQGCIVNWIWTGNLASYARFYNQRSDPHAQKEVRDLAGMVADVIEPLYPVSWSALTGGGSK